MASNSSTSSAPDDPQDNPKQDFPYHSWIAECEAAGVYSQKSPVFDYSEKAALTVTLTRAEICTLAQRHLSTVFTWNEFFGWTGICEDVWDQRAEHHEARFRQLLKHLPAEDQQRFQQQIEIRQRYIQAVKAEVDRAGEREQEFESRRVAGKVSEAEAAAHVTPPYILGYPVMPAPLDGNREPEEWDIFASEPELSEAAE